MTRLSSLPLTLLTSALVLPPAASASAQTPAPPASARALEPSRSFDLEVRLMFRMVACAGQEKVPPALEAVVSAHCQAFEPTMEKYRTRYLAKAQPFLVSLQPKGLPDTVVYPFGGGDLLSALTTYPHLKEVTTLSLEHAGDPTPILTITAPQLEASLKEVRRRVSGLLIWTESTSENMIELEKNGIPGQLAFFLVGLAVHGQEPVGLRFFDLTEEGAVKGITAAEFEARKGTVASRLNPVWKAPSFSDAFSNSEITFKKAGDPKAPLRIHRHLAADLSNQGLKKDAAVLNYLKARGRVVAMVKAASYLLWSPGFSTMADYLLANSEMMLSDSTGVPPRLARKAGFEVLAYGQYTGPFLPAPAAGAKDMLSLFTAQPPRELKFRYGYPDNAHHDHLILMRRPEKQQAF